MLNSLVADALALHVDVRGVRWRLPGSRRTACAAVLDETDAGLLAAADALAERVRCLGGTTVRGLAHAAGLQRAPDASGGRADDRASGEARAGRALAYLALGLERFAAGLRTAAEACTAHRDVASAHRLAGVLDDIERQKRAVFEAAREAAST